MIPNGTAERRLLQLRVDELERRLARLEEQLTRRIPETAEAADGVVEMEPHSGDGAAEIDVCAEDIESGDVSVLDDPDEGLEGARLVAIELLSSGYGHQEVANYLRSTFGVVDSEAVVTAAEPVPG